MEPAPRGANVYALGVIAAHIGRERDPDAYRRAVLIGRERERLLRGATGRDPALPRSEVDESSVAEAIQATIDLRPATSAGAYSSQDPPRREPFAEAHPRPRPTIS